jgi:hypothetical protein
MKPERLGCWAPWACAAAVVPDSTEAYEERRKMLCPAFGLEEYGGRGGPPEPCGIDMAMAHARRRKLHRGRNASGTGCVRSRRKVSTWAALFKGKRLAICGRFPVCCRRLVRCRASLSRGTTTGGMG